MLGKTPIAKLSKKLYRKLSESLPAFENGKKCEIAAEPECSIGFLRRFLSKPAGTLLRWALKPQTPRLPLRTSESQSGK